VIVFEIVVLNFETIKLVESPIAKATWVAVVQAFNEIGIG
jgi:hypothetical protein